MIEDDDEEERQEAITRKREDEALERMVEVAQLRELLNSEHLRDFLWRMLAKCCVFHPVWDANYGKMSFTEGKRNVGLWLLAELNEANPDALLAMQLKANRAASEEVRAQREEAAQRRRQS